MMTDEGLLEAQVVSERFSQDESSSSEIMDSSLKTSISPEDDDSPCPEDSSEWIIEPPAFPSLWPTSVKYCCGIIWEGIPRNIKQRYENECDILSEFVLVQREMNDNGGQSCYLSAKVPLNCGSWLGEFTGYIVREEKTIYSVESELNQNGGDLQHSLNNGNQAPKDTICDMSSDTCFRVFLWETEKARYFIDATEAGNELRFLRMHRPEYSTPANVKFQRFFIGGQLHLFVELIRNVDQGEKLYVRRDDDFSCEEQLFSEQIGNMSINTSEQVSDPTDIHIDGDHSNKESNVNGFGGNDDYNREKANNSIDSIHLNGQIPIEKQPESFEEKSESPTAGEALNISLYPKNSDNIVPTAEYDFVLLNSCSYAKLSREDIDFFTKKTDLSLIVKVLLIENPRHPCHQQLGCFASRFLQKYSFIGEYTGRVFIVPELVIDSKYLVDFSNPYDEQLSKVWVDAGIEGNEMRFINDCKGMDPPKSANVHFKRAWIGGKMKVVVQTLENIESGEELLVDYGEQYWEAIGQKNM